MKLRHFAPIVLLLLPVSMCAQFGLPPGFDQKAFSQQSDIALWLLEYDAVAWKTSDSVKTEDATKQAQLGQEWFCWRDKKDCWHAVYGKIDSIGHYNVVFHYVIDSKGKFSRSKDKTDTTQVNSCARAIKGAHAQLKKLSPALAVTMNTYIRRNDDNSLTVWCLPAYQNDGSAAYGGEFTYYYDASGTKLNATKQYYKTVQTIKPDANAEITLAYDTEKMPTLGSMFFALYYKAKFKSIAIHYKKGTSTLIYNASEKSYSWMHTTN